MRELHLLFANENSCTEKTILSRRTQGFLARVFNSICDSAKLNLERRSSKNPTSEIKGDTRFLRALTPAVLSGLALVNLKMANIRLSTGLILAMIFGSLVFFSPCTAPGPREHAIASPLCLPP
jgi:hypothetical protein